jgi:hypothetical protein
LVEFLLKYPGDGVLESIFLYVWSHTSSSSFS